MGVICLLDMVFIDSKVEVLLNLLVSSNVELVLFVVAMYAFNSSEGETKYDLS
jgi:hypothetical protein